MITDSQDTENNANIDLYKKIQELQSQINHIKHERDTSLHKNLQWEKYYKQISERNRSKIMTCYYMLEQLQNVGTHHEKEVVIRFLRLTLEGFMKEDTLPLNMDSLPF